MRPCLLAFAAGTLVALILVVGCIRVYSRGYEAGYRECFSHLYPIPPGGLFP
jgi:hypothetical protein